MKKFSYILILFLNFCIVSFVIAHDKDTLHAIYTKESRSIILTTSEKEWLKNHPVIRVGSDPTWPPFEFRDKSGNFHGIVTDYLKIIEKEIGIRFEFSKEKTWKTMVDQAMSKKIDMISGISITPERLNYFNFTEPYLFYPITVFALNDITHIRNLNELNGKKVAVINGYITEDYLKGDYPEINLIPVENPQKALQLVHKKKVLAYVGGMVTSQYYINTLNYKSIRIVGETPYNYSLCMGIRKDWPEFHSIMDKALKGISENERNNIYYDWVSINNTDKFDYRTFLKILVPLFVLLLIFIIWNRRLRKEVKKRIKAQTELDIAFKKLQEAQTHLVQTEKMASIGLLTAGIAHEIKNPLNFISLALEGMNDALDSILKIDEIYEHYIYKNSKIKITEIEKMKEKLAYVYYKEKSKGIIKDIQDGLERISDITTSLNSFSHAGSEDKILSGINEGIKSTLVLLRNQFKYKIELILDFSDIPKIKCFPGKLNQVFLNIIANAIQAIDKKGSIWIKTYVEDGNLIISIKDSGSGIEKEKLSTIFNPFYTTKPVGEGTGLGLAISKNIIDEHNGTIEVHSEKNIGTEFIISLPLKT